MLNKAKKRASRVGCRPVKIHFAVEIESVSFPSRCLVANQAILSVCFERKAKSTATGNFVRKILPENKESVVAAPDYIDNQNFASNQWDPAVFNGGQVFVAECFGTAILVFNVFATIDHPVEGGGALGVFPISMSVLVAHLFLVPIDGCSINPTRSFGTYLIAAMAGLPGNYKDQHYMFWLAPMCGAAAAAIIYEYGALKPKRRDGGGDPASRLHMSKATRHDVHQGEPAPASPVVKQPARSGQWKKVGDEDDVPQEHTENVIHEHTRL